MKRIWATAISFFSLVLIICIWQFVAVKLNASVIVPAPLEVLKAFFGLFKTKDFAINVGITVLRALESFAIIVVAGAVLGIIAGALKAVEYILKPFVTLFKAVPVMSIILIAFLWLKTGQIPVFSAFLMAFPIMYVQTLEGMKHKSSELEHMCRVYGIKGKEKLRSFTIPSMVPSLVTGAKQSLSMVWKVVMAAEVLTIPTYGIGRSMYLAQIQIETAKVVAWTLIAVILTWAGDIVFSRVLEKVVRRSSE